MTQDDLFAGERAARRAEAEPLAARMRPRSLDEVAGQPDLLGPGAAFRTMLEAGRPVSIRKLPSRAPRIVTSLWRSVRYTAWAAAW